MFQFLKQAVSSLPQLVFPTSCCYCGISLDLARWEQINPVSDSSRFAETPETIRQSFCQSCLDRLLPRDSRACKKCGAAVSNPSVGDEEAMYLKPLADCVQCRASRFHFESCWSIGNYEKDLREAVLRIKSGNHDWLGAGCTRLLAEKVSSAPIDLVVPIPIHWRRRLKRRSIASELIAIEVGRCLKVPVDLKGLMYTRLTAKQGTLSNTDRIKNVKNAISAKSASRFQGKTLLVVDDVMTSGATMSEAASVCRKAGATNVLAAVLARGVGKSKNR